MRTSSREKDLLAQGLIAIAGCDEAGRGCLAGPVVAAAVILDYDNLPRGLSDSKALDAGQREALALKIRSRARAFAVARIEAEEIDRINILAASLKAMALALSMLSLPPICALIDGNQLPKQLGHIRAECVVKGDAKIACIAAASILAKTERDSLMRGLCAEYPGYGFSEHFGYPTPQHKEALLRLGPCNLHRRSYRPVREIIEPGLFGALQP